MKMMLGLDMAQSKPMEFIALNGRSTTDPLSDIFRTIRLTGGVFLEAQFTAPWCIASKLTGDDVSPFLQSPAQLICYHVVTQGQLLVALEGGTPILVRAGEIVLLPRNDPHTLSSALDLEPVDVTHLIRPSPDGRLANIVHGGGGDLTHIICGFLGTEDAFNPLIATLPRVLTLDIRRGMSREWIETSVRYAAKDLVAGRAASSGVMSRLSELLLIEAIRTYSETLTDEDESWLKGLSDPQIGQALTLIHQRIEADWTTEKLADAVAMSRSTFVDRFSSIVGMPPIRYLTAWRLRSAKLQLRETGKSVAQLAWAVGYRSEEAFSRAFKREFGLSPMQWKSRQQHQSTD